MYKRQIIYGVNQYDSVSPSQSSSANDSYVIEILDDALDATDLELQLSLSNSNGQWESIVPINLHGGLITVNNIQYLDNFELNPGEIGNLVLHLENSGSIPMEDVTIEILASGSLIDVLQNYSEVGTINPGDTELTYNSNPIQLFINGTTINGANLSVHA